MALLFPLVCFHRHSAVPPFSPRRGLGRASEVHLIGSPRNLAGLLPIFLDAGTHSLIGASVSCVIKWTDMTPWSATLHSFTHASGALGRQHEMWAPVWGTDVM